MASSYPGSLDNLAADKANADDLVDDHPGHHNDLADAINAVQTELGTDPAGSESTVAARLTALEPSICILEASYSVPNASTTAVPFTSEVVDDNGYHDNATNNTRITIPANGIYRVTGNYMGGAVSGVRLLRLRENGSTFLTGGSDSQTTTPLGESFSFVSSWVANDYLELTMYHLVGSSTSFDFNFSIELIRVT